MECRLDADLFWISFDKIGKYTKYNDFYSYSDSTMKGEWKIPQIVSYGKNTITIDLRRLNINAQH